MAGYIFGCPHCRAKLEARDESKAGRVITCPQCQQQLTVPPPPPMGVVLSASVGNSAAPAPPPSEIQVNSDPGFKRGMTPAKAYGDGENIPQASSSGVERLLPPTGDLDVTPEHSIEAAADVEGYSFTVPEAGEPVPQARKKKKKQKGDPASEEPVEEIHPLEDPKYQLLIVVLIIAMLGGAWKWYQSRGEEKDKALQAEIEAAKARNAAPPPPAKPGMLPGASDGPVAKPNPEAGAATLPGAGSVPNVPMIPTTPPGNAPVPGPPAGGLPGAAPDALPGAAPMPPAASTPVPQPAAGTAPPATPDTVPVPAETKPPAPESPEKPQ